MYAIHNASDSKGAGNVCGKVVGSRPSVLDAIKLKNQKLRLPVKKEQPKFHNLWSIYVLQGEKRAS